MKASLTTFACAALILFAAGPLHAQNQSKVQQKCIRTLNGDGLKVAKAQQKLQQNCVKLGAKGTLDVTVDDCIAADTKGKVSSAAAKTVRDETKHCSTIPDFSYAGAAAVNSAASTNALGLLTDTLGSTLDPVVTVNSDSPCQQTVLKKLDSLLHKKVKQFNRCKRSALKSATAAADIEACMTGLISDPVVAKALTKLSEARTKRCGSADLAAVFPGNCNATTGSAFDACLDAQAECRACLMLNAMDAISVDCGIFDDGIANGSCGGFATTTTTTTTLPPPNGICEPGDPALGADCDGNCDIIDQAGSPDCDGICDTGDVAGSPDCNGICDVGDSASGPDCDGACGLNDAPSSADCNGICDVADTAGSPDCDGVCDATDIAGSPDCNGVCDVGDSGSGPDCDGACGLNDAASGADCNGICDVADTAGSPDCDGTCDATDIAGSPDCNGVCDVGDSGAGPDCDGNCNVGDAVGSLDCNGVCDLNDSAGSPDCDGTCDPGDDPLGPDCLGTTTTTSTTTTTTAPPSGPKIMFVSSATYTGNLGGLAGADATCNALAAAAALPGTYVAWLSTSTVDAKTRINNGNFLRTDGAAIATDMTDLLDGTIANGIACDENANCSCSSQRVRTGTKEDGIKFNTTFNCADWTSASSGLFTRDGFCSAVGVSWTNNSSEACNLAKRIYCVQL